MTESIGITTTIPAEIVFAAGAAPLDLNNYFVAHADPAGLVAHAEARGFPRNLCCWTKGLYGAVHALGLRRVIGVVQGDCSETEALMEILRSEGVEVIPFAYPHSRAPEDLEREMARLCGALGVTLDDARAWKPRLDHARVRALDLDTLAWTAGNVGSGELFSALLRVTDFLGDPAACADGLAELLRQLRDRPAEPGRLRLGCVGVPTILADLWEVFEARGARVVYHEIPRQFALPDGIDAELVRAYAAYTYPYAFSARLQDITAQVAEREVRGVIHYVQSFCHRQLYDRLLRAALPVPVLALEGDRPGPVDGRTLTRIEAFLEQIAP